MAKTDAPVLVTGITGFIGMHCALALLEDGWRVRGTLRDLARGEEVKAGLAEHGADTGRLELVEADLSNDAGWDEAVAGCRYVLHVASPFPRQPPKHEDELVIPARDGALRVLEAASRAGVERVVLTSSLAAVTYGHPRAEGRLFTEEDWSQLTDGIGAYEKSKTVAERAAWDFVAKLPAERRLELVTINPGVVLGPVLSADYGTSGELVKKLMGREVPANIRVGWAMVDVRDVAAMHLSAMTNEEAAGQRFICAGAHAWMSDVARILDRYFSPRGYRIPRGELPDWSVRFLALFDRTLRLVVNDIGRRQDVSHDRATKVLGWKPRGLEEMTVDMGESLIRHGVV